MKVTKEEAKLVTDRPAWLDRDDHWDLFKNYRDTDLSFELLGPLHGISRSGAHQTVLKILIRNSYHGLSVRARNVIKASVNSWSGRSVITDTRLRDDLDTCFVELLDTANTVIQRRPDLKTGPLPNRYQILEVFLKECVNECGEKTTKEILKKFEEVRDVEYVCGVPDWVFTRRSQSPAA